MKFNELFLFVNEENIIEENVLNKLKCVLMAGALGLTSCDDSSTQEIKTFAHQQPQQYSNLADEIGKKVTFLTVNEPEKIQEIKKILDLPDSVNRVKNIVKTPVINRNLKDKKIDVKNSLTSNTPKTQILPIDKSKQLDFLKKAKNYIEKNENHDLVIRNKWYKDNKGYPTIGIGHLVKKSDIDEGILKKGEYTLDKKGNITSVNISNTRAREIFNIDLNKKLSVIKKQFPSYDVYPESVKIVLLDGFFRGDIAGSPTTKALIKTAMSYYIKGDTSKAQKYLNSAANEYVDSNEYRISKKQKSGIYKRMDNNANILKNTFSSKNTFDLLTKNVYL